MLVHASTSASSRKDRNVAGLEFGIDMMPAWPWVAALFAVCWTVEEDWAGILWQTGRHFLEDSKVSENSGSKLVEIGS